jgi:hypothetical protein
MSNLDDPKSSDNLTEDDRFRNSKRSTIDPLHAVLRALSETGGRPLDVEGIKRLFTEAASSRSFDNDDLTELLEAGVAEGYVEKMGDIGWRVTENGRSLIGPVLEMELKFV